MTNGLLGLPLKARNLCSECRAELAQRRAINGDASNLHARKHLDQRQLDLAIEAQRAGLAQLFGERAARRSRHECGEDRLLQRLQPVREVGTESCGGNLHQSRVAHGDVCNPGAERNVVNEAWRGLRSNAHHGANQPLHSETGNLAL